MSNRTPRNICVSAAQSLPIRAVLGIAREPSTRALIFNPIGLALMVVRMPGTWLFPRAEGGLGLTAIRRRYQFSVLPVTLSLNAGDRRG